MLSVRNSFSLLTLLVFYYQVLSIDSLGLQIQPSTKVRNLTGLQQTTATKDSLNNSSSSFNHNNPYKRRTRNIQNKGCFILTISSRRLADNYIRKSETAYSLNECKQFCSLEEEFICTGIAYRRPLSQGEILNCDLTGIDTRDLDSYNTNHFYQSALTDFYEYRIDGDCLSSSNNFVDNTRFIGSTKTTTIIRENNDLVFPTDQKCFQVFRGGFMFKSLVAIKVFTVDNLMTCAQRCEQFFTRCKSFSYKAIPSYKGSSNENCQISVLNVSRILSNDVTPHKKWNIYEKLQGISCNGRPENKEIPHNQVIFDIERESQFTEGCFRRHRVGYHHKRNAYQGFRAASSRIECSNACKSIKLCKSFSYKSLASRSTSPNCLLSEEAISDLGFRELNSDSEWDLYEYRRFSEGCDIQDTECSSILEYGYALNKKAARYTLDSNSFEDCERLCMSTTNCRYFSYARQGRVPQQNLGNCLLSDIKISFRDDIRSDRSWNTYRLEPSCSQQNNENEISIFESLPPPRPRPPPQEEQITIIDQNDEVINNINIVNQNDQIIVDYLARDVIYSVSGQKCQSKPAINNLAGFWYCLTNDKDGWDYVCKPQSECSNADGYQYSWCFVGEYGSLQWRRCIPQNSVNDIDYYLNTDNNDANDDDDDNFRESTNDQNRWSQNRQNIPNRWSSQDRRTTPTRWNQDLRQTNQDRRTNNNNNQFRDKKISFSDGFSPSFSPNQQSRRDQTKFYSSYSQQLLDRGLS